MIRINRRQQQWVTREVVTAISFYGIQIIELFFFVLQMRCGHMLFFLLTSASGIRFSASFFFPGALDCCCHRYGALEGS
jgi:hypothetical protein